MKRLPAELRITLGEDDHKNVQALAKKADALWSLHGMKSSFSSAVASLVDIDEPSQVAMVSAHGSGLVVAEAAVVVAVKPVRRGAEASSLVVSKWPASLKLQPRFSPGRWPNTERPLPLSLQPWQKGSFVHAPLQLGKLARRGLVNPVSPGRQVHVVDQLSNRRFLVDTGSAFSVYPHSSTSPPRGPE